MIELFVKKFTFRLLFSSDTYHTLDRKFPKSMPMYVFFFTLLPFAILQVFWGFFLKYNVMHSLGFYLWVLQFSFNVPLSFEYSMYL